VERDLKEQLARALRQLRDDRVSTAIITRVEMTDDCAFARIFVRAPIEGEVTPRALIRTLGAASGRLRREVGKAMALKKAPELRFIHDTGLEAAERVEELLAEIRSDDPMPQDPSAEGDPTTATTGEEGTGDLPPTEG
jgi:ribosome-binding factor A